MIAILFSKANFFIIIFKYKFFQILHRQFFLYSKYTSLYIIENKRSLNFYSLWKTKSIKNIYVIVTKIFFTVIKKRKNSLKFDLQKIFSLYLAYISIYVKKKEIKCKNIIKQCKKLLILMMLQKGSKKKIVQMGANFWSFIQNINNCRFWIWKNKFVI